MGIYLSSNLRVDRKLEPDLQKNVRTSMGDKDRSVRVIVLQEARQEE